MRSTLEAVGNYLRDELSDYDAEPIPVVTIVPTDRPRQFVRLSLAGTRWITRAHTESTISVECWHEDPDEAELFALTVMQMVEDLDHDGVWFGSWATGLAYSEDTVADMPRYLMGADIRVRQED